jgi:hypothetical protein
MAHKQERWVFGAPNEVGGRDQDCSPLRALAATLSAESAAQRFCRKRSETSDGAGLVANCTGLQVNLPSM